MTWLSAFVLTQIIEISVGLLIWRADVSRRKVIVSVFLASSMTHPIVWFVMPRLAQEYGWSYLMFLAIAESYAYIFEFGWYRYLKAEKPFLLSCVLNSCSFFAGLLIYIVQGFFT